MKGMYFLLIILFTCTANAAWQFPKCFTHSGSDTCISATTSTYALRWYATCNSKSLEGVAFCSSTSSTNTGDRQGSIKLSSSYSGSGVYCYCRIVSPFVSTYWVYAKLTNSNNCAGNCAQYCSDYMQTNATFRQNILGSLND